MKKQLVRLGVACNNSHFRTVIHRIMEGDQNCCKILWTAQSAKETLERCRHKSPDLILMDTEMSSSSAIIITLQEELATSVLIVTPSVDNHSTQIFKAIGDGAVDAVCVKEFSDIQTGSLGLELLKKIKKVKVLIESRGIDTDVRFAELKAPDGPVPPLIAMGASTGGPKALSTVLTDLPKKFSPALVMVQHLDTQFASEMATWLCRITGHEIRVPKEGERIEGGRVYFIGGDDHAIVGSDLAFHYIRDDHLPFHPSVDVFFRSLKNHWPKKGTAVLMTGMGRDGAKGLLLLKKNGWYTIAQDEATSVVFGMPGQAIKLGAAKVVLPLEEISAKLKAKFDI